MQIKIISHHTKYKKGQTIDLTEKEVTPLLTNGKAIRVRKLEEAKIAKDKKLKNV